jgi:hypothetical protein
MASSRFLTFAVAGFASLAIVAPLSAAQPLRPFPTTPTTPKSTAPESPQLSAADLDALVVSLGASSLRERTEATTRLSAARPAVDALFEVLKRDSLSAEQRERVTRLAWERFASTPRAALGISFQRGFVGGMESGAVIEGTFEGFDSNRVLKPGDTIYAMDDVRIHSMDEGKRVIQSREPGERVSLRIFRQGKPIIVRLTLGSLPDLDRRDQFANQRSVEPAVLRDAFRLKLDRALASAAPAAPLDLQPHWEAAKVYTNEMAREQAAKLAAEDIEPPSIPTAGGRQGAVGEAQLERFTSNPGELHMRLSALNRELRQIDTRLQALDAQLDDPNVGGERRTQLEKSRRVNLERRAKVKESLNALQPGRGVIQP